MVVNLSYWVLCLCEVHFRAQLTLLNYKQHAVSQNYTLQSAKLKSFNLLRIIAYLCGEFYPRKWSRPTHNSILQAKHIGQLFFQIFCFDVFLNCTAIDQKMINVFVIKMRFCTIWVAQCCNTNEKYFFVFPICHVFCGSPQKCDSFQVQGNISSSLKNEFLNLQEVWIWRSRSVHLTLFKHVR